MPDSYIFKTEFDYTNRNSPFYSLGGSNTLNLLNVAAAERDRLRAVNKVFEPKGSAGGVCAPSYVIFGIYLGCYTASANDQASFKLTKLF
jgi:hypothetical protein